MKLFLETLRGALGVLGHDRRWRWAVLVGLAAGVAAVEAVGAVLVYALVGLIAAPGATVELPLIGSVRDLFPATEPSTLQLAVAGAVALFFVLRSIVIIGQGYVRARVIENATAGVATELLRGYLALPYEFHTERNSAQLIRNAHVAPQEFANSVLVPLVTISAELLMMLALSAVLLVVAPLEMLLAVGVLGLFVLVLLRLIQPRLRALGERAQEARGTTLKALQEALGGIRDIRLLGREDAFAHVYGRQRFELARSVYARRAIGELPRALIETVLVLIIVGVFAFAIRRDGSSDTVVSTLGVFAYAGLRLQPSLQRVVASLNELKFGSAVLDDLLADRRLIDRARATVTSGAREGTFERSIELRQVTFAYGGSTEAVDPVLDEVTLEIRRGEFVGICGPTGGGKSTLVDLIVGLLAPTSGQVLVDGHPVGDDIGWWYRQLGVVSQSVFLVDDTLRANIALGDDPGEVDQDRLARCVAQAQLTSVVEDLPAGLDTIVGERGVRLSGGQRQRIAVARALYREPAVIVLDEGTSALDMATESALVAAIDNLPEGSTLIAVAHRISTVEHADRILVIEQGRIAAEGSYEELIHGSELFRSLAR